jgi:hypothetical protein
LSRKSRQRKHINSWMNTTMRRNELSREMMADKVITI